MNRIAILSVSAGAGHVRCAEALRLAAASAGMDAVHIDVMDLVPTLFRRVYVDSYLRFVQRRPALWGYVYHATDAHSGRSSLRSLRRGIERIATSRLEGALETFAPDAVVCTHFLPAQVMSRLIAQKRFSAPVWVVVTDFDLHAAWIHPHLTGYCAAAREVSWRMRDRGLSRIEVTGLPLMPAFAEPPDRDDCARELGLDPDRPIALVMSGGVGMGELDVMARRLLDVENLQVIAIAGRNADLLSRLRSLADANPRRLIPLGFTSVIHRIMACADIAVTKTGGLTTAECLAMSLPVVVVTPLPGQEERNADYLLEHGAALRAYDHTGMVERVRHLLQDPAHLARMRVNAGRLGRPHAAHHVIDAIRRPAHILASA